MCTTVKTEIEDMSDPEPSRMIHEDTEEQTGPFLIVYYCRGILIKQSFS